MLFLGDSELQIFCSIELLTTVIKPEPARRVDSRSSRPGSWTGLDKVKNQLAQKKAKPGRPVTRARPSVYIHNFSLSRWQQNESWTTNQLVSALISWEEQPAPNFLLCYLLQNK
jgi:hypothetical protein